MRMSASKDHEKHTHTLTSRQRRRNHTKKISDIFRIETYDLGLSLNAIKYVSDKDHIHTHTHLLI